MPQMVKAQRNQIVRALIAGNLDPAECELVNDKDSYAVRHVPSASEIIWTPNVVGTSILALLNLLIRVGTDPIRKVPITKDSREFEIFADRVSKWAAEVRELVDTPDLWELSRSGKNIPGELSPDSENTPFTPDEQASISAELKAIAEAVKKDYDLTAEQSAKLDEKFEEAEKASRRMGRKDWGTLFGGAVFSLILADVITPGIASHILVMIDHGIGYLYALDSPSVHGILSGGEG